MSLFLILSQGLAALGIDVSDAVKTKLLDYIALLKKWNKTYNLTAVRDEGEMLTQHILDSLAILPALQAAGFVLEKRWADVGSGAGLPGIPLAVVHPEIEVTLIETVEKKSAFQRQAKIELGLSNVEVISTRVESFAGERFDIVVSRAFSDLADFIRLAGHLIVPGGRLYAMKGARPDAEIKALPSTWRVDQCLPLHVPGLDAQRHLIVLERV